MSFEKRMRILRVVFYVLLAMTATMIGVWVHSATANTIDLVQTNIDNETINVSVHLTPTENIRAWEFKALFDPNILQVTLISCGDFFHQYEAMFHPGAFNNTDGKIINVYALILGWGNVTEPGNLSVIKFHVLKRENTTVELYDQGICNSTKYLNLTTNVGNIVFLDGDPIVNDTDNDTTNRTGTWLTRYFGYNLFSNITTGFWHMLFSGHNTFGNVTGGGLIIIPPDGSSPPVYTDEDGNNQDDNGTDDNRDSGVTPIGPLMSNVMIIFAAGIVMVIIAVFFVMIAKRWQE
jgi:hypothetical protein